MGRGCMAAQATRFLKLLKEEVPFTFRGPVSHLLSLGWSGDSGHLCLIRTASGCMVSPL